MEIYDHLRNIGYDGESAKSIENRIYELAEEYLNKEKAKEILRKSFNANVHDFFSNFHFDQFIKIVKRKSFEPRQFELEEELGSDDNGFYMLRNAGELSEEEIKEYLEKREAYAKKTRPLRELCALRSLEKGEFYSILKQKAYRQIKEKNPNFRDPRIQIISTPMGGQGHWRRKMKRR